MPAITVAGLFVAGALIPRLNVGLDQAVALPNDSYLQQYYRYGCIGLVRGGGGEETWERGGASQPESGCCGLTQ
jgi:hypothetical protein